MVKLNDLTGQRFGRLVVLNREKSKNGKTYWLCQCDCGNKKVVMATHLKTKDVTSCGCYKSEKSKQSKTLFKSKHGLSRTRINQILSGMKQRCFNKKAQNYKNYGGRGVTICEEWICDGGIKNFYKWATENGYKDGLSIDRIDTNGNYCPENCRWADYKIQANNTRKNHIIEYNGEKHTISQWADIFGVNRNIIDKRIQMGKTKAEQIFKNLI